MRVERLRAAYQIDVKYTHFPLHPDTPEEGLTLEQLFAGRNIDIPAAKAHMTGLMADEGLDYGDRTMTYNSRLAHPTDPWEIVCSIHVRPHRGGTMRIEDEFSPGRTRFG